jgi:hypothetical protein
VRLIDSTLHRCLPGLGVGKRWLRERLMDLQVKIPLTDGCLQELFKDAEASTWHQIAASRAATGSYLACLREQLDVRAELVRRWTGSDEPIDSPSEIERGFVRIARQFALPRPWKLSEPEGPRQARPSPDYFRWASRSQAA